MANDPYAGPGGAPRNIKPKRTPVKSNWRMPATLPSGALVSNPGGPSTTFNNLGAANRFSAADFLPTNPSFVGTGRLTPSTATTPRSRAGTRQYDTKWVNTTGGITSGQVDSAFMAAQRKNALLAKIEADRAKNVLAQRKIAEQEAARQAERRNYYADPSRNPAPKYTPKPPPTDKLRAAQIGDKSAQQYVRDWNKREAERAAGTGGPDLVAGARVMGLPDGSGIYSSGASSIVRMWRNGPSGSLISDVELTRNAPTREAPGTARVKAQEEANQRVKEGDAAIARYLKTLTPKDRREYLQAQRDGFWNRSDSLMRGVDTMLQRDRFAKSRLIRDTGGLAANLSQAETANMIAQGLISYGKPNKDGYRQPVFSANLDALERYLDDNFTQTPSGELKRKHNQLITTDEFKIKAAGSTAAYDEGRVYRSPRLAGVDLWDAPTIATPTGDKIADYASMATQYVKDEQAYATLNSKIDDKIRKEGGGALLDKIRTGNYTAKDVANLRQYMYSFNGGPYVKSQERWLNEQLLGIGPAQFADAAVAARDANNYADLVERNAKTREKVAKEEAKAAAKLAVDQFDNAPKQFWTDNLIGMIDTGVAGNIPRYVLNDIFYQDVAKDQLKVMDKDQLARLQLSVVDALNAGAPVDPILVNIMGRLQDQVSSDAVAQAQDTRAASDQPVWRQLASAAIINPVLAGAITWGTGQLTGKDVSASTALKTGSYNMTSPGGSMYRLLNDPKGPLSPENTDSVFSAAFLDNAIKSPIRAMLGMPMGIYMGVTDPLGTGTAMLKDYGQRYGALWGDPNSNFIESSLQDPWAPAMDILGLVPVVGAAAKATSAARIAMVTSKVSKASTASRVAEGFINVPTLGKIPLKAALDMGPTYGPIRTMALRELERQTAEAAGKKPARAVSAWKFADAQARALAGDARAEAIYASLTPEGYGGLNSAYTPHLMDKVASWFVPRWKSMSLLEGMPETATAEDIARIGASVQDRLAAETRGTFDPTSSVAMRRMTGSPLARGMQEAMYFTQRAIARRNTGVGKGAKTMELLANMPLTGFNFRFARALEANPYGALDLMERQLFAQVMHERQLQAGDLQDHEHLAIMSMASGQMYSPQFLRQVQIARLRKMEEAGIPETDALYQLTKKEYSLLSDETMLKNYADTIHEINTRSTERGKRLAAAIDRERRRMDRMSHEAGVDVDAPSARQLTLRYQNFLNAMNLMPKNLIDEINAIGKTSGHAGNLADNIGVMNGWWHMTETGGFRDAFKPVTDEAGNVTEWRPLKQDLSPEEYNAVMDRINQSVEAIAKDPATRTTDKTPMIAIDRVDTIGGRRFVVGRHLTIDGEYTDLYDQVTRKKILSDQEVLLPEEWFVKKTNVDGTQSIKTYSTTPGGSDVMDATMSPLEEQLQRATLNYAIKAFPDARDFVDKVSTRNFDGKEPFAQKRNENSIASSGLMSFRLEVQWAAHRNAIERRFRRDIQTTLERNAVFVTRDQFEKSGDLVPLRTLSVFDTKEQAIKYANGWQAHKAADAGEILEINVNGQTKYATRMSFLDVNAATLKEMLQQRMISSDEWYKSVIGDINDINVGNIDNLIAAVPKKVANEMVHSYERSDHIASRALKGYTKTFKLMALALNPRFITQQTFGAIVMMMLANPMQAGHIMAKFLQYSAKKRQFATGKWKMTESDPFTAHGDDYDIIMNRFIRDFEDNVYGQDAFQAGKDAGWTAKTLKTASTGYVIAMAMEKNMRVAIVRDAAMHYPGFKEFMTNPDVLKRASQGIPDMGYKTVSPFHAAMDLMSDPKSKHYDPIFLRELRHTADMISGNYRDFTGFERKMRDFAMPFYAWTRHSALYTKRMVQERPLTANTLYNLGNYGYDKIIQNGGLPDWLLESVPMPNIMEKVLGLDPEKDNRLGFGSISPFGTTADNISAVASVFRGDTYGTSGGILNMGNPLFETLIEQSTGNSLMTGAPIPDDKRGIQGIWSSMFMSLPPARIVQGLYESSRNMNELRGKTDPSAIFKDPYNPEAGLSIPEPKLSQKFTTDSAAGIFNILAPTPAYSVDPEQLGKAVADEYKQRNVLWNQYSQDMNKGALRTATALNKWKYKRDFIYNIWLPAFGKSNPDLASQVLKQLEKEKPVIPKGFPQGAADAILTSGLRKH